MLSPSQYGKRCRCHLMQEAIIHDVILVLWYCIYMTVSYSRLQDTQLWVKLGPEASVRLTTCRITWLARSGECPHMCQVVGLSSLQHSSRKSWLEYKDQWIFVSWQYVIMWFFCQTTKEFCRNTHWDFLQPTSLICSWKSLKLHQKITEVIM